MPVLTDAKGNVITGIDLEKHNRNLQQLKRSTLFATEFIDNYDQLVLTIDKGIKTGRYGQWVTGELPPFQFSNDVFPWCMCQGAPDDDSWKFVEIETISLDSNNGKLYWNMGKSDIVKNPDWGNFKSRFNVVKENNQWKISYMEGFDIKGASM
ncbi:MAG TPA: hypothetical protein VFF27_12880 [Bacteroidia bacterium]|nr:hypothetical protein [Bacteroidia bacterium]